MREQNRAPAMPESLLAPFAAFLAERIGLYFPRERWHDLEVATRRAAHDLGYADVDSCIRRLLSQPLSRQQVDVLASHLTVGETYFFRDDAVYACLERLTFPELIASRRMTDRRLRIWSAGCSSGEEAYSVAMLIATLLPDLEQWDVRLLATDINPRALEKAVRGEYNEWSFRGVAPGIKERFFTRGANGRFQIADRIKALVKFSRLNLVDDAYPGAAANGDALDVILCRNVLMYFHPDRSRELISRLGASLLECGWLFVSPVDVPQIAAAQFEEVTFPGAIAYRKALPAAAQREQPASRLVPTRAASEIPARPAPRAVARPMRATERPAPVAAPPMAAIAETERRERAAALYADGRYADVIALLNEQVARAPVDTATLALLARSYANQGQLADAERWCRQAVAGDRFDPDCLYLLSTILQERDDFAGAETALSQVLYLDPDHALAHFALGNLLRRRGKLQSSQRHLRNALSLLDRQAHDEVLANSEGLTAGRLADLIRSMTASEVSR